MVMVMYLLAQEPCSTQQSALRPPLRCHSVFLTLSMRLPLLPMTLTVGHCITMTLTQTVTLFLTLNSSSNRIIRK